MAQFLSHKEDCKPFWGLSLRARSVLGGMCTRVGAGNIAGKVLFAHKVGEEDLQLISFVHRAPVSVDGCLK